MLNPYIKDMKSSNSPGRTFTIFGATGSIGTQLLEILEQTPSLGRVRVLTANRRAQCLAELANAHRPDIVVLCDPSQRAELEEVLTYKPTVLVGEEALEEASLYDSDLVINALVGFSGFMPTVRAIRAGKTVALANKESLVVGGAWLSQELQGDFSRILPVDSEHSAMWQALQGESRESIQKIIITASGGPFREWSDAQMESITPKDALKHPNWSMGSKITIDSSTLMNKGLEMIEAHWLFGLPMERIEPVVHPQSIIHSVIEFVDGSSKAQLGPPDMKVPILYALTAPHRVAYPNPTIQWQEASQWTFEPVDHDRFPCIGLAIAAQQTGGMAPAVLNAANEVAVARFLQESLSYKQIAQCVEAALDASVNEFTQTNVNDVVSYQHADQWARRYAKSWKA